MIRKRYATFAGPIVEDAEVSARNKNMNHVRATVWVLRAMFQARPL